jgi:hypothetical protein
LVLFSDSRDPLLSYGAQLLLFKPNGVSKADVNSMEVGEGKETTKKGKLEM